jgi:pimeloyl-ACP methyl ester carboxylesterase
MIIFKFKFVNLYHYNRGKGIKYRSVSATCPFHPFTIYNIPMPNIKPFGGVDSPMNLWPSLATNGNLLPLPGGELFFYDCKTSSGQNPPLVFIHGLGDEADTWRHILPRLCAKGYRCIAPDLLGFGRSLWRGRISVSRHAEAVIRLMTELSVERPAVLIGSSLGGGITELVAFKRPDMVQALILLDGCFPVSGGADMGMLLAGLPFFGRRWYRGFRSNHEAAWKSLYS